MNKDRTGRIDSLDYLRGLMALGIMLYHNYIYLVGPLNSQAFIERVGYYGVSIFFVLSGLTLSVVYSRSITDNGRNILGFYIKRVFRIFPLMWLAIILTFMITRQYYPLKIIVLNITGLFSVVDHTAGIAMGQWSIGDELLYYVLFPGIILLHKLNKWLSLVLLAAVVGAAVWFSFFYITAEGGIAKGWNKYTHPMNHLFFFVAGALIPLFFKERSTKWVYIFLPLIVIFFSFYPTHGDSVTLVTGINRFVFSACSILICYLLYSSKLKGSGMVHRGLKLLGDISYSVYMLHPLFIYILISYGKARFGFPGYLCMIISCILALILSIFSYFTLEKRFISLGQVISNKLKTVKNDK